METLLVDLPPALHARLDLDSMLEMEREQHGVRLFRVADHAAGPAWLKVGACAAAAEVDDEAARLHWLGGRLSVPRVLLHEHEAGAAYLLLADAPGVPGHRAREAGGVETVVAAFAAALRAIHAIPVSESPFTGLLEAQLAQVEGMVQAGSIDAAGFLKTAGGTPAEVLRYLQRHSRHLREPAFVHGDYCLPNTVLQGGRVTGLLDWGQAGVCDRNRDFMAAEGSIRRNLGAECIPLFYRHYGIRHPDTESVRYFWLLDRMLEAGSMTVP
jgi:aminoglycoside phosphotransferase